MKFYPYTAFLRYMLLPVAGNASLTSRRTTYNSPRYSNESWSIQALAIGVGMMNGDVSSSVKDSLDYVCLV